jgi:hypothetical protein
MGVLVEQGPDAGGIAALERRLEGCEPARRGPLGVFCELGLSQRLSEIVFEDSGHSCVFLQFGLSP